MKVTHITPVIVLLFLLLVCETRAQNQSKNIKWEKLVARDLDMSVNETKNKSDSTLYEMIYKSVETGQITAYSPIDCKFTMKLTVNQFKELFISCSIDTATATDSITGQSYQKIIHPDFSNYNRHKYWILEDWTFDPLIGHTTIQIIGIAPARDIIVDGELRNTIALFWLKYNEVLPILVHYEKTHPGNSLASQIWDDYFYTDVKPTLIK